MSKLVYHDDNGMVISVEAPENEAERLEDVIDRLVIPVLLGATFQSSSIAKYIKSELVGNAGMDAVVRPLGSPSDYTFSGPVSLEDLKDEFENC